MSMTDLEDALNLIDANRSLADFAGPRPEVLIKKAESALGLAFPPTYRKFVLQLGVGDFSSSEFYGVIDDDFERPGVPNAIWLTLDERKVANAPHSYIIVSDTGDGGWYAIDLSKRHADGESPVVEWWPGATEAVDNGKTVAEDFGAFMLQRVQQWL